MGVRVWMMRCGARDWKLRRLWNWRKRDEEFGMTEGHGEVSG